MSLNKPTFGTEEIDYNTLRVEMEDRINHIKLLAKESSDYYIPGPDTKPIILEEFQPRVLEIIQEIKTMRHINKNVQKYLDFTPEILKKYDIPIITEDNNDIPYSADLNRVVKVENSKLHSLIFHLKEDYTNDKITAIEADKKKKTYQDAHHKRTQQVLHCKEELQKFIDGLPAVAGGE